MRLLLVWAALAAHCWAFSLNIFSFGSEKPYLHPLSPPETDPTHARVKRQAYQVYVDGDSSVSVDKSGQAESGNWGPWTPEGQCSRTCGGGVQVERRQCGGDCTGASVRYVSCNIDACAAGGDFRAEQCAAHNDDALDGNYHKWLPYKGKNKCELLCKPETGNFYYKWDEKVVDGTPCDNKGEDICVDGVCLALGCDGKLGSAKKVDKCGKCDGDGSTCKTIEGFFDERNLSPGYHDVIKLPAGATAIKIAEARPSSNNLALKNSSDHYYLNGNSMLQVESDVEAAGTVFEYDDDKPERISAKGPLTEDITVSILFRKGNKDAAIRYEFSIPLEEDVDYMYKVGDWSACSVTCGKGVMTRTPFCIDTKTQSRVEDSICDDNNATKPEFEKPCETVDCAAEWYTGDWEDCSETCGNKGEQYRVVYCHQVFANGRRITVDDGNCTESRPAVRQQCNRFACPEWQAGPWSACSEKCGDAFQYRSVTCRSEKEGDEGKLLPADSCDASVTLETQRTCNLGPCEGLTFLTTEWKLCSKCNDTEETREVSCKDNMGRAYPLEKCLIGDVSEIPTDTRTCATQQPCIYEWTASQWSKCSTECGHGHKTRRVVCAIHQLGDLEVVDEYHCQGDKPEERSNCTNEEKCTGTWYTGPWEQCSEECGGGKQTRMTVCLNYDKKPVPEWCDEAVKPTEEQECNVDECPTCFDSEFGCCPDNSTFATGDFLQGCSNCSLSTFGCCADNITEATGANSLGCPEFVESPLNLEAAAEGSGDISDEIAAAPQECKVTSEGGEEASVDCALALNGTTVEDGDLFGNGTDNNGTIHCSKTEFGCCPDWFTPASGKNNEGCAEFVQGACNGTQFGCCVDEITLARGPNFEGCGEPSCAASLYGCCKDRTTIAFGPHYAGCERSSFPCELSAHGCCPDGETAALGKNGTGCGENCLTTKFGCCPDGMTVAKGDHNEGCGCEFAQFGCCPDGKTAAQGAGYFGCPESCAQSQYGCCPDGKTTARGLRKEGCPCQYTRYGCCPDGETTAHGPKMEGCDDCRYAKYGCCADGVTKARGPNDAGCPATTTPPFIMDGTVSPFKISQCALPQDSGNVCGSGYKLMWFYDSTEGRCQQFWYGGCGGNENKYQTKDMCESICVEPPAKGRCYLPKVEGPLRCDQPQAKYYYDHTTRQCAAFWWRGCLGNANNFNSWEECSTFCKDVGPIEQPTEAPRIEERPHAPPQVEDSPIYEPIFVEPVTQAPRPEEQPQQIQEPARERPPMPSIEEICRTTADAGPCESKIDQFFFNAYSGSCEQFTYGGCGGNLNRFRSVEECQQRCGFLARRQPEVVQPQQHQQPEQPQQHAQPQPQHYEQQQQQQQPQPHTFPVQPQQPMPQQPQTIIPSGKSREACHMKVDTGRCKGTFDSWYFEVATGSCVQFKYTGCGGNSNRFHSKEECEGLCVARSTGGEDGPAGANSVCDEAKETGTCTQFVTKWYYNKADGTCNRFHYGSCGGTGNRFESEQACKAACSNHQDVCTLPKVQGPCSGKHTYYFYNSVTQTCETFVYGGCLGNTNRFGTIEECQARCGRTTAPETELKLREPPALSLPMIPVETSVATVDPCTLPKATGKCTDAVTMYYYDSAAEMCLQFYFGGCDGNENRFATLDECVNRCRPSRQPITFPQLIVEPESTHLTPKVEEIAEEKEVEVTKVEPTSGDDALHARRPEWDSYMNVPFIDLRSNSKETETERSLQRIDREEEEFMNKLYPPPTSPLPELCLLPEERGPCFGNLLRYKYNQETKSCESFMYGGCEGNANHFTSEEACERNCGIFRDTAVCSMQQSLGECAHSVSKWYFNAKKGACELMMWTGCGGNGNRFSSREECESLCSEEYAWNAQDICELPRSAGPCSDAVSMWYYDSPVGECKQFTYGGCRGNPNRFVSKEACESRCAEKSQNLVHINAGAVCQLPFETGSCNEMTQKWFFDFATGQCHHFSYGGCGGNENRFNTRAECLGACATVGDRVMEPTKARIFANGEGPFEEGSEITLTCEADGQKPIVWYKDGNILYFDIRVEEFDEFERVLIRDASAVDSGAYSCAVGPDGLFSETFHVKVNAVKVTEPTCVDVGNHGTCSLIVKAGLCGNKRYGIFCCGSCTQHGLRV